MKNKDRAARICLPAAVFICAALLAGCAKSAWAPGKPLPKERVKIGVIHITDPFAETSGYSWAHKEGIREMQSALGLADNQIIYKLHIQDADNEGIESAMRDCIAAGANIIIATSWGYMEMCQKLAAEFPGVVFAHASGYQRNETNFTNYFGRVYQARYLSGVAAGLKTKTNKIGYVAAMGRDNSEVTGGINAFALGVERVNPQAKIYVHVTQSWFDPMEERESARSLIAAGCDVLAQHCDSANPQLVAQAAGMWGIGYNSDMSKDAPNTVLTSVVWRWGVYYTHLVQSVMDGSFTTKPYFGGISEGMVDITPLAAHLAESAAAEKVASERQRIVDGGFNVFDGALQTNDGKTVGKNGTTLSDGEITGDMHWYYRNVIEF